MTHITLITVGSLKEPYLLAAVNEYTKRLSAYARVDTVELKEERINDEDNAREIREALRTEGERILRAVPKGAYTAALCVEGVAYDSVSLAEQLHRATDACGRLCLIIGSSHGLCDEVKRACDLRLSVSKLTFPHQLMRVLLLEILYRSFTITAGKRYHK